jgi:hypothetical protein
VRDAKKIYDEDDADDYCKDNEKYDCGHVIWIEARLRFRPLTRYFVYAAKSDSWHMARLVSNVP